MVFYPSSPFLSLQLFFEGEKGRWEKKTIKYEPGPEGVSDKLRYRSPRLTGTLVTVLQPNLILGSYREAILGTYSLD